MKKQLLLLVVLAYGVACGGQAFAEEKKKEEVKPPCCRSAPSDGKYTDKSLYLLESKWTSDVGREIKLGALRGRIQIVAMFFTHCEYACPIIVGQMKKIEAAIPVSMRDQVDFLLVSMDSERDTADTLRDYRGKAELAAAHWTLLRGSQDDVRELAALLGINYKSDGKGQFTHTNLITVLSQSGEIAFQQAGLDTATDQILSALTKIPGSTK